MSLNSLQDDMSRRAASMAAMAKRARNPQEIQAIQKSLIDGVQSGAIQPHVGIPLIQDLTKELTKVKAQMAQSMAGAGMQQPQQGGAPQQPIAQQIMAQAQQGQGVETLPSNLPESYAGGGIIAFEEGGPVERYQSQGLVPALGYEELVKLYRTDPGLAKQAALRAGPMGQQFLNSLGNVARASTVPLAVGEGGAAASLFANEVVGGMTPEQRKGMYSNPMLSAVSGDTGIAAAIQNAPDMEKPAMSSGQQIMNALSFFPKTLISAPGDSASPKGYGLSRLFASDNAPRAVAPTATPAANINKDLGPVPGTTGQDVLGGRPNAAAPSALPGGPGIGGGGGFKMPTLPTMKDTPLPQLTDYNTLIGDLPAKAKTASEAAVRETQTKLEGFDKPGFDTREEKLGKREAGLEKDSAMTRALNLMNLGFGIAGSKERTLAGALGNEGRQGIQALIQGEAANRAAKDRLDDARDNFEQQKVAAKKGNYQAAQAAGKEASRDLQAATQLTMTGAHYGNTESLQRYQTQQQGEFQKTSLGQSGALGLAGLDMQNRQLNQTAAFQNKQLGMMEKRYEAMDAASKARMGQVRAKAFSDFNTTVAPQLNAQFAKEYGPNWRTGTDARSLQAQMLFKQQQNSYLLDALGQYDDRSSARDSSDL